MIGMWLFGRTHLRYRQAAPAGGYGELAVVPVWRFLSTETKDVNNQASGGAAPSAAEGTRPGKEWRKFLLLAFVGLPITMTLAIAAYGFVVWFLQILFFGPPS